MAEPVGHGAFFLSLAANAALRGTGMRITVFPASMYLNSSGRLIS